MDPVTAGLAFATAISQVSVASVKLKRLWRQISAVPDDVRHLIDKLEIIDLLLDEMRQGLSATGWSQDTCTARCQRLCTTAHTELEVAAKEIDVKLSSSGRIGRKLVAVRAVLDADAVEGQEKRLERAVNLLFFAHQIASSRRLAQAVSAEVTRGLLVDIVPKLILPVQSQPQSSIIRSGSDESSLSDARNTFHPKYSDIAIHGRAHRSRNIGSHQGWVKRLRFPTWWSGIVFEVRSVPQVSSYNFRIYHTITENARIISSIKKGNLAEVCFLLESKQASPYDIDPDGWSLLHYAVLMKQPEVFRMVLELGCRDLLFLRTSSSRLTPIDMVITRLIKAEEICSTLGQILDTVQRYLRSEEVLPEDLFNRDILWRLRECPGSVDLLREKLLVDYYQLPVQQRIEHVRSIALWGGHASFVKGLLSPDGTVTREDLQESTALNTSLLCSAALGMGAGLDPEPFSKLKQQSVVNNIIQNHTIHWTGWIEQMATEATARDLHVIHNHSTTDIPWAGSPFWLMFCYLFWGLLRSNVKIKKYDIIVQTVLKEWVRALKAGGVNLLEYGQIEERLAIDEDVCLMPRGSSHVARYYLQLEFGGEIDDWKVSWELNVEELACEFWEIVERPREIMPGTWVEG